jgi:competence protein ComEC
MRLPLKLAALALASAWLAPLAAQPTAPAYCPAPDSLGARLTFLDVGQGDAALLETADGQFVLVDAGPNSSAVRRMLESRGVGRLSLVIATHNHLDHIGGLPEILRAIPVDVFMDNGLATSTVIYRRVDDAVAASGALLLTPQRQQFSFGATRLRILAAPTDLFTQNDRSIGLVVTHGAFDAILTGDGEIRAIAHWLANDSVPRATVVKAAHHGSSNATTPAWVAATSPDLVVISVGRRNRYDHPAPEVLEWWSAPGRTILRTDERGTVDVRGCADGSFRLRTAR